MLETKLSYEDYIKVMMLATTNAAVVLIARSQSISEKEAMFAVGYEVQEMIDRIGEKKMLSIADETLPNSYQAYYEDRR